MGEETSIYITVVSECISSFLLHSAWFLQSGFQLHLFILASSSVKLEVSLRVLFLVPSKFFTQVFEPPAFLLGLGLKIFLPFLSPLPKVAVYCFAPRIVSFFYHPVCFLHSSYYSLIILLFYLFTCLWLSPPLKCVPYESRDLIHQAESPAPNAIFGMWWVLVEQMIELCCSDL